MSATKLRSSHGHSRIGERGARASARVSPAVWLAVAVTVLVLAVYLWQRSPSAAAASSQVARLALAIVIGVAVTFVHKRIRTDRTLGYSLERAQTLLCLAGALTMILIDNSIARAFGVAGAASIVRFRTPVEDPTDATVLFLLMGLGMACGVGAFGVAVVGATGVCLALLVFGAVTPRPGRQSITVELRASGRRFPASHVRAVFARHDVLIEPCEWSQDAATRVRYRAWVPAGLSLEMLGADLMNDGAAGLESVAWEVRKGAA